MTKGKDRASAAPRAPDHGAPACSALLRVAHGREAIRIAGAPDPCLHRMREATRGRSKPSSVTVHTTIMTISDHRADIIHIGEELVN
jgi:hypothetical protein